MEKKTLIMAAAGVWLGAGLIFLVWFLGGDAKPEGSEAAVAPETMAAKTPESAAAIQPAETPKAAPAVNLTDETSIAAASLPPTASQTPPLDGGKVSIEVPEGWKVLPRNSSFVIRMSLPNLALPLINVRKAEAYPNLEDVTPENAPQLAAMILQQLKDENKKLTAPVTPVRIGRNSGDALQVLRFARQAKQSGVVIEVLTVIYAKNGQHYEIELQAHAENLEKHASSLYAVAASIELAEVSDFGSPSSEPPAEADSGEETPAE